VVAATRVLAAFRAAGREIASRRGVRIAKWLGDGAMVVAVDPTPLVEAILEAELRVATDAEPLALRAGITYGDAILFEGDDYIGTPVNLAACLCDLAGPHEALVGEDVDAILPPWAGIEETGTVIVKGFPQAMRRRRLCIPAVEAATRDPVCGISVPADLAVLADAAEGVGFCSASCADAWPGLSATG
jgi:adenylate cyclase